MRNPPRRLVAGHVLKPETSVKLSRVLAETDPPLPYPRAEKPHEQTVVDNPERFWRTVVFGDFRSIELTLGKHLAAKNPELKGPLEVRLSGLEEKLFGSDGGLNFDVIVAQALYHTESDEAKGILPSAAEGGREVSIRKWLESKGNVLFLACQ